MGTEKAGAAARGGVPPAGGGVPPAGGGVPPAGGNATVASAISYSSNS